MKTVMLLIIGVCLLGFALVVEMNCQKREQRLATIDANINQAQSNLKSVYGGSYRPETSTSPPVSRTPVFIIGGFGAMFLLAGLISFGSKAAH